LSTLAYQGAEGRIAGGDPRGFIQLRTPDLTVVLDASDELREHRMSSVNSASVTRTDRHAQRITGPLTEAQI